MLRPVKYGLFSLILIIGLLIVVKSIDYYTPDFEKGYLSDKELLFNGLFKFGFYAHIATVPFIFSIGTFQAFFRYEGRRGGLHRKLGNIYCLLVLGISGPGALILSFFAFGGWMGKLSFIILSLFWVVFTYFGFKSGKARDIVRHRKFMIRSYVLSLSAIFLRILSFLFIHYFHFSGEFAYALASWLSWVPLLIFAELYLNTKIYLNHPKKN